MSYQKDGCLCCGTFPYMHSTGMCATCTFGEADAQQELMSGKIEGAVWEREQPKKNKRKKRRKPKNKGGDL